MTNKNFIKIDVLAMPDKDLKQIVPSTIASSGDVITAEFLKQNSVETIEINHNDKNS